MSPNNKKYDFTGKVALVTGSSSGIGAAIATQFAQYGAQVTITGREVANLEKVAKKIEQISNGNVKPLQLIGNLRDDPEFPAKLVNETIAKFGRLDILVNSAGGGVKQDSLASATLLQDFDYVLKLNVRAVVELTQLAVPHLEKTKGNVINISSGAAILPKIIIYCSTKAALDMVTKTSALELGPKGIRVNSINPGPVVTSIGRDLGFTDEEFAKVWAEIGEKSLLGRVGQPVDIANLASFLASDDARNITGSINVCDGGLLIGGGGNVKFRKDE